jgi:hypothetical protein
MVIALILIIVGVGAAVYAMTRDAGKKEDTTAKTTEAPTGPVNKDYVAPDPLLPTIVFNNDGFTQKEYRFPAGTAIKVDNQSDMDMQFSSDDHPSHKDHSELNMKLLGAGESGTFTPPGKGTYGFHDHINDQYAGTLIIE